MSSPPLALTASGAGAPVWLVHGQITNAHQAWKRQEFLSERWRLVLVHRPGYGTGAEPDRSDWVAEGAMLAESIEPGAHLVGHSYGAMVAAATAAVAPVESLTLVEPPAYALLEDDAEADSLLAEIEAIQNDATATPAEAMRRFLAAQDLPSTIPDELTPELDAGVRLVRGERLPWDGDLPVEELARTPFPKQVISGGDAPVRERAAAAMAEAIGAEHTVIDGGGHNVQRLGEPFNEVLENFLLRADATKATP